MFKNSNAFTLIELILYVAIVGIVTGAMVPFASAIITSGEKNITKQETSGNVRFIVEKLKYEIRNANDLNIGTSNFGVNLASNSSYQLSLANSAPNNPTIFNVLNGNLQIKKGASAAVVLNSSDIKITNLVFTNNTSVDFKTKNISYTITLETAYAGKRQEYIDSGTVNSSIELRSN